MIDAKFTKIPKIWVQLVTKNDAEIFLFCHKKLYREKIANFLPSALVLAQCGICCFLKKADKIFFFTFKSFISLITENMWQTCFYGSFHDDNGAAAVPPSIRNGPGEESDMKVLCKLQNGLQMFIILIS